MFGSAGPLRPLRRTQAERHSGAEGTSLRWTQGPIPLIGTAEKQVGWLVPSVGQGGTRWDLWRRRRTRGSRGCRSRRLRAHGPRASRSSARLRCMGAAIVRIAARPNKHHTKWSALLQRHSDYVQYLHRCLSLQRIQLRALATARLAFLTRSRRPKTDQE